MSTIAYGGRFVTLADFCFQYVKSRAVKLRVALSHLEEGSIAAKCCAQSCLPCQGQHEICLLGKFPRFLANKTFAHQKSVR